MSQHDLYCWERLHLAVIDLAAGVGSVRERVTIAHTTHLMPLISKPIPWPIVKARLTSVLEVLNTSSIADRSRVNDTDQELACEVAKEIVSIYDQVTRLVS